MKEQLERLLSADERKRKWTAIFVSKQGQFKLTRLPNGKTLLEGTTWYYHAIKPAVYWQLWSNYIIHKIHNRVLLHIKKNSEV